MLVFCPRKKNKSLRSAEKRYRGLVLFDIDGTLVVGRDNEAVVQACIDNNFAVGICTAGRGYTMKNLLFFHWMPHNLYEFIRKHNDITFNNVADGVLMGKLNPNAYLKLNNHNPGYLKGFAMVQTGKSLGITNPKCIILCDDQQSYLDGARQFNPHLNLVCTGDNCGGNLTVTAVTAAMKKC